MIVKINDKLSVISSKNDDNTIHIVNILNLHKEHTFKRTFNSKGSKTLDLLNCALGFSGEAGEVVDQIKKKIFYGTENSLEIVNDTIEFNEKELDKIKNEIGDTLYYLQGIANLLGSSLDECIHVNIDKLYKRFPNKFSREEAQAKGELK